MATADFRATYANVVPDTIWYTLAASTIFFLATGRAKLICCALENRVLVFLGKRSYGIYILHEVVAHAMSLQYGSRIEKYTGIKFHLYGPMEFVVYFCITVGLATLSFKYFETPILNMRERRPLSAAV